MYSVTKYAALVFRDEKSVQILRLIVVTDKHEYSAHQLEIALIPLRLARSQDRRRSLVQAKFASPATPAVTAPTAASHSTPRGIIPAKSKPFSVPRVTEGALVLCFSTLHVGWLRNSIFKIARKS